MTKPTHFFLSTLLAAAAIGLPCSTASAATVYRCGPQANVYSDLPCAGGRVVDADDARSNEQRAQAIRVAALDRRFADEMQRERLLLAAATRPAGAAGFNARPVPVAALPAAAAAHPRQHKRHAGRKLPATTDFIAIAPIRRR